MVLESMQDAARSAADSGTPHYNVSCQSCRVSKTFFTMQGVNSFVMEHDGHMVIEGRLFESPLAAKKPAVVAVEAPKPQAEEAPEAVAAPPEVDVEEAEPPMAEVPEVAAESDAVNAQDAMSLEEVSRLFATPEEGAVYGVEPPAEEAPEVVEAPDHVAAQEVIEKVDVPEEVAPMEVDVQELKPVAEEASQVVAEPAEEAVEQAGPRAVARDEVAVSVEAPVPPLQAILPAEVLAREPLAAAPPLSEKDLKEPLLLARSSYIGESEEKRMDALRVSRALKEFKWNVEPPYVIGVMVDDNLSVETNIGVISTAMVARVEKLGYKFVAVNAPQESPVAWFKKEAQDAPGTAFPAGDPERMMQIHHGKWTYDGDKAVWEESFVSLLMSVKDMDGQKLKHVTEIIKSERPEPDIKS